MALSDPGSFRDPASHVVYDQGRVIRVLTSRGLDDWKALEGTAFFRAAVDSGRVIAATEVADLPDGAAGALEHPRVPMVSYPYEWTFSMLKDAALLQLDLLRDALAEGLTIKDATPYNIQFVDGRPVFIDIGSFERYEAGEPWIGYRQFTRQFLFPLMMRSMVGVPFQPWLRGDIEGPTPAQMRDMLPSRTKLKPSVMMNVTLQARMEDSMADRSARQDLKTAGFTADLIQANVAKLRALVESLEWSRGGEGWASYHSCDHVGRDRETKADFLRATLDRVSPSRVLDLGANDGYFSAVASDHGVHAVAVDADESVLDELYLRSRGRNISVVVSDLANPSPSQGWAGVERPSLFERARPELIIAYGLIHHLIYSASIPVEEVLRWLASFQCPVVLEYVAPEDEMVVKLTQNKLAHEIHPGGDQAEFRSMLDGYFRIEAEQVLGSATRVLFELRPR